MGWVEADDGSGETGWNVERLDKAQKSVCVRVKFLKQVINHVLYTRIHTHVYKHITVLVCAHTRTRICIKNFKHVNMHKQTHFKNIYRDINTKKSSKTYLYENRHS